MQLPLLNQLLRIAVNGEEYATTCVELFDGGYGYYFDALFPKGSGFRFREGAECSLPDLGTQCVADFVRDPSKDTRTVRFFMPKWS